MRIRQVVALSFTLAAVVPFSGCSARPAHGAADTPKLPTYAGHDAELFDDSIEPAAFGLSMDRPHFRGDARFRERTQRAQYVAQMKVTTVTIDKIDERAIYHLRLARIADLSGKEPEGVLDLTIKEGTPAYAVLATIQTRARDKTVIAMWKLFRDGEETAPHYYLAPDDDESRGAVREALALEEVAHP